VYLTPWSRIKAEFFFGDSRNKCIRGIDIQLSRLQLLEKGARKAHVTALPDLAADAIVIRPIMRTTELNIRLGRHLEPRSTTGRAQLARC
jgi:hypothetical protein